MASGEYGKEVARVAADANQYLIRRIPKGVPKSAKHSQKLAVVFDIDETTLSNARHIQANDYGYIPKVWDAWVAEGQATAIYPVQAVYNTAVNAKVDVFFITGRSPDGAAATERNLRQVGYETWSRIIYKPADFAEPTRAFKIDGPPQARGRGLPDHPQHRRPEQRPRRRLRREDRQAAESVLHRELMAARPPHRWPRPAAAAVPSHGI